VDAEDGAEGVEGAVVEDFPPEDGLDVVHGGSGQAGVADGGGEALGDGVVGPLERPDSDVVGVDGDPDPPGLGDGEARDDAGAQDAVGAEAFGEVLDVAVTVLHGDDCRRGPDQRGDGVGGGGGIVRLDGDDDGVEGPARQFGGVGGQGQPVGRDMPPAEDPLGPQAVAGEGVAIARAEDQRYLVPGGGKEGPDALSDRAGAHEQDSQRFWHGGT